MQQDHLSDAVLVERFQTGNAEALDRLIHRHESRMYNLAFRLTGDRDQAADVVAEAHLRLFRSTHQFRGQCSFTTWLYRIILNCFLDLRKKASARATTSLDWFMPDGSNEEISAACTTAENPYDRLLESEQSTSLRTKTNQLPKFQQTMIGMFHWEMLSYAEIAHTLNLPIGTVKSRLNRARHTLRSALGPEVSLF